MQFSVEATRDHRVVVAVVDACSEAEAVEWAKLRFSTQFARRSGTIEPIDESLEIKVLPVETVDALADLPRLRAAARQAIEAEEGRVREVKRAKVRARMAATRAELAREELAQCPDCAARHLRVRDLRARVERDEKVLEAQLRALDS